MPRAPLLCLTLLSTLALPAQIKRTSVPLADTLTRALAQSSLTIPGSQPFHLRLAVSEPANPQSPCHGTLELWWASPTEWRRELTGPDNLRQLIVTHAGQKTEQDTGDYLPLWLRNFQTAILDPVPDAAAWLSSNARIEQSIFPDGRKSDACAQSRNQIGPPGHTVDVFSSLCFDERGRLHFIGGPRLEANFESFEAFGSKEVPRLIRIEPDSTTHLSATVSLLEPLDPAISSLFTPLAATDDRFHSVIVGNALMTRLTASEPACPGHRFSSAKQTAILPSTSQPTARDRSARHGPR